MKIAIVGKAGCGKTTFARLIEHDLCHVLNLDEWVNNIYNHIYDSPKVLTFFRNNFPTCFNIKENSWKPTVNKEKLAEVLSKDSKKRIKLENFLYKEVFKPLINKFQNVIVDGILPRFTKDFDLVLYSHVSKQERRRRLKKRGVSKERISQIESMQKGFYDVFKKED